MDDLFLNIRFASVPPAEAAGRHCGTLSLFAQDWLIELRRSSADRKRVETEEWKRSIVFVWKARWSTRCGDDLEMAGDDDSICRSRAKVRTL